MALNVATGDTAKWFPTMEQHYLRWLAGSVLMVAAPGLCVWWAQRRYEQALVALVPAAQRPESWMVDRPAELTAIVGALRRRCGGTVGITTAVHGAGGFGKTTLARLVRADPRVLRWFGGRVYWVTLGRDVRRGGLVEKINDLVQLVDPARAHPFTDVRLAAEHLAAVLADGPRRLVILDDVWFDDQLKAFPVGGRCARLVTTRLPSLVTGQTMSVKVDQMSPEQARRLLTADLPQPPPCALVDGLLEETGRWPLLLRLCNRIMVDQTRSHADVAAVAQDLLQQLRRYGALQVDQITGAAARHLDVSDPDQRDEALTATIEASTGLLTDDEHARFAELTIFIEDEIIPVSLVRTLWQSTGGLNETASRVLIARLADLALLNLTATDSGGTISLHDVVREYLHRCLGKAAVTRLHQVLLDTIAAELPRAPAPVHVGGDSVVAWWALPNEDRYLRDHLIEHLLAAEREADAAGLVADLRWAQSRLEDTGPLAPFADLTRIDTPQAARLNRLLGQAAHLLTPTEPAHSLIDILYARVAHDPDWGPQAQAASRRRTQPKLVSTWPLPDLPYPALRRTLAGHTGWVNAVAIARDGTWLASAGSDGVRIWDPVTGEHRGYLAGHIGPVRAVAIALDGTWLASAGSDGVRIWDPGTGEQRRELAGHTDWVNAVAIAPDGTWLASAGSDGSVRIWDPVTGEQRRKLAGHTSGVNAVAIARDGTWLASAGSDGSVRIWDPGTGEQRRKLAGHTDWVNAVAIAPDGAWVASAGSDGVRIWDPVTGEQRRELAGHTDWVNAVAIAPDGTWLASAGYDGVRIWDPATGEHRGYLAGHTDWVLAVAIARDGTWLAGAGRDGVRIWDSVIADLRRELAGDISGAKAVAIARDGTWLAGAGSDGVRIWDPVTGDLRRELAGQTDWVNAVAIAPDGTWLASAGSDGSVRIWDPVTAVLRRELAGHTSGVNAVAIARDGTWLASAGSDGSVRIWDPVTGQQRRKLAGHTSGVNAVAIAPDGTWLATAAYDGSVGIWDPVTGEQRRNLAGHTSGVNAVAIAPDGTWLASAGRDGSVRIWDPVTGEQRRELAGHTDWVNAVAIARDGTWLASAGSDGTLRIWRREVGVCAAMMRVDGVLTAGIWGPARHDLLIGGRWGMYRFEFQPAVS
ncbi:NB-ARC domain-containing protein [Micromonospora purpureochromogenes]|uniref:NB-ARC domain-containing protein n=1 Tax=Micromonospora purpureochromogenes TaxID=47872 RepID=UPI0033C50D8B